MVSLSGVSKAYGGQVVLADVSWSVPDGTRVGLAGPNGAGKSTILRIIAGEIEPDRGTVAVPRGTTVGYLPQHVLGAAGTTVRAFALTAFAELHQLEARRAELEHALATLPPDRPEYAAVMARYVAVCEEWDRRGRYDTESEALAVLTGLGFREADFDRDCGELSGGWQMRAHLARLLLRRPDVLLLDEPTNYLDLEARNWLEDFLTGYPGTVILVAHDRYFLDVAVDHIAEVLHGRVTDYPMNYSRYLAEREKRLEQARAEYENQKAEIERIEAFIHRFRYQASKAALVQSRVKQLEKIERLPPPDGHERTLKIRLPEAARSGRVVLELAGASKMYDDVIVYDGADVLIERGQRIAIVGPNGAGKTTLLKMLAGVLPLDEGERRVGQSVRLGYFAQDHAEMLREDRTALEELMSVATVETAPHVRGLLGAFLFSGDAVDKRVGVLSGGERSRLALAKLLLEPVNCLLLDEPTNHLDLTAKEVLLEALRAYQGTIVIVAHDRYILDELPTQILEVGTVQAVRYVPETRYQERTYTVCRPVWETRTCTIQYTVCKPVWETRTREVTCTVCKPVYETHMREVCEVVCKPVKYTRKIKVCSGHWETREVPATCAPATCAPVRQCRVWVPEVVEREVQCVKYVQETVTRQVPYTVCRMVAEQRTKTCQYQVCRMETEQREQQISYQVCRLVSEPRTVQVPYTVCRAEPFEQTVTCVRYVAKQVPYTVTRCVPKWVERQVPVKVCCPVPCCCQ